MKTKVGNIFIALIILITLIFSPFGQESAGADGNGIHLAEIGRYDATGAEISVYDPTTKRLYVTGAGANVEVLNLSDPANPSHWSGARRWRDHGL